MTTRGIAGTLARFAAATLVALAFAGCGDDDVNAASASSPGETSSPGAEHSDATTAEHTGSAIRSERSAEDTSQEGSAPTESASDVVAQPAPLPAYSGGECPEMATGRVQLNSAGRDREIALQLPAEPADAPVLFVYHGNGSNAAQFESFFQTARIASEYGVIVVTPESTGSFQFEWPILSNESKEVDETLFTDVLDCLNREHGIDRTRVYTTGFSAGGLWSTWLTLNMTDYLASAAIFAGGTSSFTFRYTSPSWQIPVLATHGGPEDVVVINFQSTTLELARGLAGDGHLTVVCAHDQGHVITWDIPDLAMPWLLSHSFGNEDESFRAGLDDGWPSDCALFED